MVYETRNKGTYETSIKHRECNPYSSSKSSIYSSKPKYSIYQLNKGTKVEYEHTSDKKIAKEIARTHLKENPDYYVKYNPNKKSKEYLVN